MRNVWSSKRGTSLVEILVVMVVLLVGIMTVIQMFPTGFRVVKAAESQTIATRLAQQEIERWKSMAGNLPDGMLPVDESGAVLDLQEPGPPFQDYLKNPDGSWTKVGNAYARGNVLNVRQVYGETTAIPVASYFQTGSGSTYGARYTLAFGPIDTWRDPEPDGDLKGLSIKSGDLRRVVGDSGYAPPYLRAGQYAIDHDLSGGAFHVAFPVDAGAAARKYYISYTFWASQDSDPDGEWTLFSVVDQAVGRSGGTTVDGNDGDWIEVPIPSTSVPPGYTVEELESYSETCARGFAEQPGDWTSDPYEFKLADSIVGVIAFNPAGHGTYEYTARGVRPIQARVDYLINDLRIMREDRVIPRAQTGATDIPIKLSLRFILNVGDPTDNPNEESYEGLVRDRTGNVAVSLPMLVIDLATGWRVEIGPDAIDFRNGIVNIPPTADLIDYIGDTKAPDVSLVGRHLRFFYRADGDWSVQCHKAYSTYSRKWGGAAVDYRTYKVQEDASFTDGLSNRLLFAPCELGKTVIVDYTYRGADGADHKTVGEEHRIDKDTTTGDWFVDLGLPKDCYLPRDGRMIVVGASFTVRVIWRDGKIWRHVDMDTNLTRG